MKIDHKPIEAQLQGLTPVKVKVRLDRHMSVGLSVRETDNAYAIRLNPSKIRSQINLDKHIEACRQSITKYGGKRE